MPLANYTMPTNTKEPTQFNAGETIAWEKSLADYSANDGWTLKYTISGSSGGSISKTASGSGTTHTTTLTASDTAALSKGTFRLFGYVQHTDGTKIGIYNASVKVLTNLFTAATTDQRTDNQIILDAIIAVIKGRATKAHAEIAIAGRNIMLLSPAELYKWQKVYEYEVKKEIDAERIANGGSGTRNLIQFVNPS
jgi:hypothetical protein